MLPELLIYGKNLLPDELMNMFVNLLNTIGKSRYSNSLNKTKLLFHEIKILVKIDCLLE